MRIKNWMSAAAMLLGLSTPLAAFGQFHAPTQEELHMTSYPGAPDAAAVYLYREEIQDDPHHFHSVYARIKVLKDSGTELATVNINYRKSFVFAAAGDNSSHMANGFSNSWDLPDVNRTGEDTPHDTDTFVGHIEIGALQARTIHPDGTIVPMTEGQADLLQKKLGENQVNQLTFTLPDVHKGDILEYYYQVRYDRFQQAPFWQVQFPYPVLKEHFVFIPDTQFTHLDAPGAGLSNRQLLDRTGEIETDVRATSVLPPGSKVQQDALGHYYVDFNNVPPTPQEPFAPPLEGQIYHVQFYYIFTPSTKIYWQKEMDFWEKALDKYIAPTPLIESTAKEITSGAATPLDKAKALYNLVQKFDNQDLDQLATIAPDDGSIPFGSVEQVLQAKRGSSRQLTFLYLSLARAAGLDVRPIRLAGRDRHLFSAETLDTSQLDSVIVGITIDGKEIYLDPGERMAPFETLYWAHAGAGGVALKDGKVETLITPLQDNRSNTVVHVGTLNVSPDGQVSGTLKVGFIGQQALAWRQLALRSNAATVQQEMEAHLNSELPNGVQTHIERLVGLDDPYHQLVAVIPVTGMLATSAGKHLVLPRLFFDTRDSNPFPAESQRVWPVDMHYPAQEQEQITYQLPAGFKLETPPADVNERWAENAAYIVRTQVAANSVTNARILARGFTVLDPSQYSALRDFYQKVAQDDHQQLVLDATN